MVEIDLYLQNLTNYMRLQAEAEANYESEALLVLNIWEMV